ncbi:MAG: hypothetical protein FWD72_01760 [Eggerthellaceae bacterium]|nr:hypothetical protein [Eggerthellaceae bacterium]
MGDFPTCAGCGNFSGYRLLVSRCPGCGREHVQGLFVCLADPYAPDVLRVGEADPMECGAWTEGEGTRNAQKAAFSGQ